MKYYAQFNKGDLCKRDPDYAKAHGYDPSVVGLVLRIMSEGEDGAQILHVDWGDLHSTTIMSNKRLVWAGRPTDGN